MARSRRVLGGLRPATIARRIAALGVAGFGGRCFAAAQTINREVFGGRGRLVGAANAFWLNRGRFFGHVAVFYAGNYWDADGRPKEWDEVESWGMLAPDDPDYFAPGWNEEAAYKVRAFRTARDVAALHRAWKGDE